MNRPVLGFFSTAGEAGLGAGEVAALSAGVEPLRTSLAWVVCGLFEGAGMLTFAVGFVGCGVAGLTWAAGAWVDACGGPCREGPLSCWGRA